MGFLSDLFRNSKPNENSIGVSIEYGYSQPEIPEFKGNYAKAVFLNAYKNASPIKDAKDYQQYFKYEFGIRDASAFHKQMIDEGYLGKASIEERLLALRSSELKQILQKLGYSKTGKKEELVHRITANNDNNTLLTFLPQEDLYSITEKGRAFLHSYADIVDLYNNRGRYGVSYDEYIQAKARDNKSNYHDILWGIYQERAFEHAKKGRIYVSGELNMYYLLYDEKRYADALDHMVSYFYYYINEIQRTQDYIALYHLSKQSQKEFFSRHSLPEIAIPPFCVEVVKKMKDYYKPEMIYRTSTGFIEYCSKEEFLEILEEIINDTFNLEDCERKLNARVKGVLETVIKQI